MLFWSTFAHWPFIRVALGGVIRPSVSCLTPWCDRYTIFRLPFFFYKSVNVETLIIKTPTPRTQHKSIYTHGASHQYSNVIAWFNCVLDASQPDLVPLTSYILFLILTCTYPNIRSFLLSPPPPPHPQPLSLSLNRLLHLAVLEIRNGDDRRRTPC